MTESKDAQMESLEEEVFRALDHQKRRDILRFVGEGRGATFTEVLNATGMPDSPTLSYHLRSLAPFMEQREGRYGLTPIGRAAYSLLLKTADYSRLALIHKKKTGAIIGHIVLWTSGIAAALVMEVDTFLSAIILPSLAGVSLMVIYELFE
ncbi:MAG: helix-turn-helix transcriptional regulator [Candidatus Bathyarchaeota archaeon]|nr:MAG: helix-turn-helix transcriptional regulator [Candidatus Bathyarchaeota archaeon]